MAHLYRVYANYQVINEYETFYENFPSSEYADYFLSKQEEMRKVFNEDLNILAKNSLDIVDGWDFKDEELLSIIGKKDTKNADKMYQELLDVVRKNPLNE